MTLEKMVKTGNVEVLGAFTRVPKGRGWKPSYFSIWQGIQQAVASGCLNLELYKSLMQQEANKLTQDYETQKDNLAYWPECHVDPQKLGNKKEKEELKKWLKQIAFINHLGPYKGFLFPTTFGEKLEIIERDTFRSAYAENGFQGTIPSAIRSAVSDQELQKILETEGLIGINDKSTVYSYKINTGSITLPEECKDVMTLYGNLIANKLSVQPGAGFTIDYMLSQADSQFVLQPIELHTTPLGIYHDFKNTGKENLTDEYVANLSGLSDKIALLTTEYYLKNGFYGSELKALAAKLTAAGVTAAIVTCDSVFDKPEEWLFVPYKADFTKVNGVNMTISAQQGVELEDKAVVNNLLQKLQVPGVVKPISKIIGEVPSFYQHGKTFCKEGNIVADLEQYTKWKQQDGFPDMVVIKPIVHHQWNPQILNLADPNDGKVLFKHIERYRDIIVENMVKNNPILGNGEIRVTYIVK